MNLTVIVDPREQKPLIFDASVITKSSTLATGDYSIEGYEQEISVERKTVTDLYACIGRDRERFDREVQRLRAMPHKAIVVEGTLHDLIAGQKTIHPSAILGSIAAWAADGVFVVPCSSATLAAAWTLRFLVKAKKRIDLAREAA